MHKLLKQFKDKTYKKVQNNNMAISLLPSGKKYL